MDMAVVIATFHAENNEQRVFGPFRNGDVASRWGLRMFPSDRTAKGDSVTWCWQDLIHPLSPYVIETL